MADEKRIERAKAFLIDDSFNTNLFERMADFASIESKRDVAAKLRKTARELTNLHSGNCQIERDGDCDFCEYFLGLTAEADALEGK